MLRVQGIPTVPSLVRATSSVRVVIPHVRTLVTPPDPTKPTSDPALDSASSKKEGSSNTVLYLLGAAGVAGGIWYYLRTQEEDPHAKQKEDEARIKKKGQELKDAGKQTAHDVVKEGHQDYHDFMTSGREKLEQARASADGATSDAKSRLESYKKTAEERIADATHKAEQTYADAKNTAANTYHDAAQRADETRQSWGELLGSWVGYGKKKTNEAKKEGAEQAAQGARKVESEAQKRT